MEQIVHPTPVSGFAIPKPPDPALVSGSRQVLLIYVRAGGGDAYSEAVSSPLDTLVNALTLDNWDEVANGPRGLTFIRVGHETGREALTIEMASEWQATLG